MPVSGAVSIHLRKREVAEEIRALPSGSSKDEGRERVADCRFARNAAYGGPRKSAARHAVWRGAGGKLQGGRTKAGHSIPWAGSPCHDFGAAATGGRSGAPGGHALPFGCNGGFGRRGAESAPYRRNAIIPELTLGATGRRTERTARRDVPAARNFAGPGGPGSMTNKVGRRELAALQIRRIGAWRSLRF